MSEKKRMGFKKHLKVKRLIVCQLALAPFHIRRRMATRFLKPAIIEKNIEGHKRFIREVQPDFIKLMSDGYFAYPNPAIAKDKSLQELATIQPLDQTMLG